MITYILLFQCPDRQGIVARVSDLILRNGGNILMADQHTTDPAGGHFFMRVEFYFIKGKAPEIGAIDAELAYLAGEFDAEYRLFDKDKRLRMGILVSKPDHCLVDLLYLWKSGDLKADIPFIISNYEGHREVAAQYKVPFQYILATRDDRKEESILRIAEGADFLVLARYMLVLSNHFLETIGKDMINIHHGLLPSFKGAGPYRQAFDSGVKVIGATAHFVTDSLDEGPIIAQEVEGVSHKDSVEDLRRKGRWLEKRALSHAICAYLDHRVIRHGAKTVVF